MQKLKLHSPELTQANIDKLAQLFPNCVAEAHDAHGMVKRGIDFDQLRQELSGHIVEGPQERYQLNWPGKREALLTANAPIAKALRPCRAESVDFDTTQNLFIEGDNLDPADQLGRRPRGAMNGLCSGWAPLVGLCSAETKIGSTTLFVTRGRSTKRANFVPQAVGQSSPFGPTIKNRNL